MITGRQFWLQFFEDNNNSFQKLKEIVVHILFMNKDEQDNFIANRTMWNFLIGGKYIVKYNSHFT